MLIFVIAFNCLLALINFYVAWKILRLRKTIAGVVKTLNSLDRTLYNILHPAPGYIYKAQTGSASLRDRYDKLGKQLQKAEKFISLMQLILKVWPRINNQLRLTK